MLTSGMWCGYSKLQEEKLLVVYSRSKSCYSFNDPYLSLDINRILISLSMGILFLNMLFGYSLHEYQKRNTQRNKQIPSDFLQIDFLELYLHTSILL